MNAQIQRNRYKEEKGGWGLLWVLLSIVIGTSVISAGCLSRDVSIPERPKPYISDFAREEGGRLYGKYCAPCHGVNGKGDGTYFATGLQPRPADFTDREFMEVRTDQDLFRVISGGSTSVGRSNLCPPWGYTFNETEIEYLIRYIRRGLHEKAKSGSPRPADR